ncbi:hypothetical protein [Nonomuraea endophytica]|uniref:Uncharacterized protein n=1 Tax=Nonomuraea endophytica TaxID=714136 RepID=A0A7W8ABQ3_9ACTN|nr:hypothetical protein [Nonomuraea endophytica]MBB5083357.1 hypothetical protein [Nonomuraea endophytica]
MAQNLGAPRPILPAANAQAVLDQAANVAQRRAFTAPRPDQWVYTETRLWDVGKPGKGEVRTAESPLKPELSPIWVRADGKRLATVVDGEVWVSSIGGESTSLGYASVAALPRDPDELLA